MRRLFALSLLASACGDPIVDTSYRGEPIWFVEGTINAPDQLDGLRLGDEVRASLFWSPNLNQADQPLVLIEQTSVTAEVRFPATFEVRVFEPPELDHFVTFDGRYAVALLLIYVDEDRDGFFGANDDVVGGTLNKALVFAREVVPAGESPSDAEIPIGFSLVNPPLACPTSTYREYAPPPPPPEGPRDCQITMCPEEHHCNAWGFCEPEYPLTITVLEAQFIPKNILCL